MSNADNISAITDLIDVELINTIEAYKKISD